MRLYQAESAHWYQRTGEPSHTIVGANGKERAVTLRDAKKLGLLPSVTNILGVIARPELVEWKMEQAVLSALTLPREEGESDDAYAGRVVIDSLAQSESAAAFGSEFHEGAARVAQNPLDLDPREQLFPWLKAYREWFLENIERVFWSEKVVVNGTQGYAGTADLYAVHRVHGLCLIDLKTQGVKAGGIPRRWSSWLYQLAAYRQVLGDHVTCLNLVVNSARPEVCGEQVWSSEQVNLGWEIFRCAAFIWRGEKGYNPITGEVAEERIAGDVESAKPPKGGTTNLGPPKGGTTNRGGTTHQVLVGGDE